MKEYASGDHHVFKTPAVSVPLRGRGDERLIDRTDKTLATLEEFPSPCGEEVMKASFFVACLEDGYEFPSPCGEEVMKATVRNTWLEAVLLLFPSPCGEEVMKVFELSNFLKWLNLLCFRPLAGKR